MKKSSAIAGAKKGKMYSTRKVSEVLHCRNCGEEMGNNENCVIGSEHFCMSCVLNKMNIAIMKYPISGAGEE